MRTIKGAFRSFAVFTALAALVSVAYAQSALQFTAIRATDESAIHLEWASQSNHVYQVRYADTLIDTNTGTITWQGLYDDYPSQGTNTFWLDTGNYFQTPPILHPRKSATRFYQIVDKGPDDLVGDEPTVSISSPSNGFVASGLLAVSVTASTDQGSVDHRLYVDGQEMWPSADGTNYFINTCEWGNGPHVLFATVRSSTAVDGPQYSYGFTGYGVSAFVAVVFSNLVTRISFSEPFFRPSLGQTQLVSAIFAANSDWTLQIQDINSNTVRTATGSGSSLQFSWDGTGNGGTTIPDGVYYYYISVQTNGQAFQSQIPGGGDSGSGGPPSPSLASSSFGGTVDSMELFAMPSDGSGAAVPLVLYPPGFDTNRLMIFEASLSEMRASLAASRTSLLSASTMGSVGTDGATPMYSGASSEAAPSAPMRSPTTPTKGSGGKIAIGYQMYNANGTNPVYCASILDNNLGVRTFVQMQDNSGTVSLPYAPFRKVDKLVMNFASEMMKGSWDLGRFKDNNNLSISDLRGSGTFLNEADLGLLCVHGTYGTSFDTTPGRQVKQIYFPITAGGGAQYIRMSEMSLGGSDPTNGLKWVALMGCFSLYPQNWNSMQSQQVKPYNSNLHLILGCATDFAAEPLIGQYWADYMMGRNPTGTNAVPPLKIRNSWYSAANDVYKRVGTLISVPNPTELVVAGDNNAFDDYLQTQTNTVLSGTWRLDTPVQVYPPQ